MTIYCVFQWCDEPQLGNESSLIGVFSDSEKAEKCKEMAMAQIEKDCDYQAELKVCEGLKMNSPYDVRIEAYTLNRFVFAHETEDDTVYDLNDKGILRDCDAMFLNNEEKY